MLLWLISCVGSPEGANCYGLCGARPSPTRGTFAAVFSLLCHRKLGSQIAFRDMKLGLLALPSVR